ncbi:MAG TPA: PQQ-dependent sugar dehydrogenase [Candidatus Binatia bacterium]|nr:PQQ-dependent sugar dehydrogenase [Candidatus Binatia bacterium]
MTHAVKKMFPWTVCITTCVVLVAVSAACNRNEPLVPYGLDARPASQCPVPQRPPEIASIALEKVFTNITVEYPVAMVQEPGASAEWYLVEQSGRVRGFTANGSALRTVLDLRQKVIFSGEAGLLDLAFHPNWLNNHLVFLSYNALNQSGRLASYIARFQMTGLPWGIDPASEKTRLEVGQPFYNHNGGRIGFGPDGYLYIGLGDGGSGGDPLDQGQNRDVLLGKILRIDVDLGSPYSVPAANPFASGGGRPEIFAWGFRNPWRWSFDSANGDLWVGDVGQNRWEEIDLVRLGGNYGWRIREGAHCYNPDPCEKTGLIDPVVEYPHQEGCSVTAGFVYHGADIPALRGVFLFGDYCSGNIWGVFYDADGNPFRKLLAASGLSITAFAQDHSGEVYVLAYNGVIAKLVPAQENQVPFPTLLSMTGFVNPNYPKLPSACLIPYDLIEPFWSDGAEKERYFYLPDPEKISVNDQGHFDFPIGSVLIKNFLLNGKRIETRLLIRHNDGEWAGYSYEWDEAETDAVLLASARTRSVNGQNWTYPSRAQCLQCHTFAAGRSLGTEIRQLNRHFNYSSSGRSANQLTTYDHIGLLSTPLTAPADKLPVMPKSAAGDLSLLARAKAYLHVNCSYCHRPGSSARGEMDLRFDTALPAMNICEFTPLLGSLGIPDARILAPGAPLRSVLLQRIKRQDVFRMPPIGNNLFDNAGILLLENWILSLQNCQ